MLQGLNWTQFQAKDEPVRTVLHKNKGMQNSLACLQILKPRFGSLNCLGFGAQKGD